MDTSDGLLDKDGETDKSEDDTNSESEIEPPDGGWGWVICFACFMAGFIFDGVFYTFGIVFLELTDHFDSNKETGAWIASVNYGICMIAGPFISALCNKFGFRSVTIAGALMTSLGLVMSSFATSLQFLYFSYGVVSGLGYGMVYTPSIIVVTLNFSKKRAFATGLALCGNGLGVFGMSPLTEWLLRNYNWEGTFLIQAGLLLNGVLCGLVYQPLGSKMESKAQNQEKKQRCPSKSSIYSNITEIVETGNNDCSPEMVEKEEDRIVQQKDTVNSRFKQNNKQKEVEVDNKEALKSGTLGSMLVNFTKDFKQSVTKIIIETFDLSLLKNVPFCMFTISSALYCLAYYIPFLYIPDVAKHAGIDEFHGAWLLSSFGVTSIISGVVLGKVSDIPGVNRLNVYSVSALLMGLAVLMMPVFRKFWILLCFCILFGLFEGLTDVLMSVLVADLLGTKHTCQGFGVLNLFSGIASFFGPPFAGWMYDVTAGFHVTFYVCGAITSFSGAMLFIHPCFKRARRTNT